MEKYFLSKKEHALKFLTFLFMPLFSLILAPLSALAWDTAAHQTVAWIAQARLTPQSKQVVDRLLAQEPGSTLASITSWADEHRSSENTHWHYVNFPRKNCHYQAQRDCPDGECLVAKIDSFNATLHSNASDAEKLLALKFLVHLVGDIHQPLHAGFGHDKGGNRYQVQYLDEPTNLHALWDGNMVEQFHLNPEQLAQRIMTEHADQMQSITLDGGAPRWAEQSCNIVLSPGFYPHHKVTSAYLQKYAPVVQEQVLQAGVRLAEMLNTLN